MTTTFQRRKEDFTCEHCGTEVKGSGYTNHCPQCLWSKHVDVNPGDRAESCGGMMEPVATEGTVTRFRIRHKCKKCGFERMNDLLDTDNADAYVQIAKKKALQR